VGIDGDRLDAGRHGDIMLSTIVHTETARRRHLETPIGPYLDGFLSRRLEQGFAAPSVAANLKWVTSFGEYLAERQASVAALCEADLEAFAEHYRCRPRRRGPPRRSPEGSTSLMEGLHGSVRPLLDYLRSIGATAPTPATPLTPYDAVLSEYVSFLRVHRGFAELTVEQHRRWASAFFAALGQQRPQLALDKLGVGDVEAVVGTMAAALGRRSRQIMTTNIDSLMRYLRGTGQISRECMPFLPRMKAYALSSLPSVIAWSDVERAVTGIDRSDAVGRRDHAMVLLVATYGLRAAEVVGLQLDDIDWRRGVLHVRQRKTRRMLELPLVAAVRESLIAYLRDGRGATTERHVFLKIHAPRGRISRAILYTVVRKALTKAGIEAAHLGPHALRHARASALLRSGRSLKTIGDLLGHRVPEATLIYCKIAVEDLRTVALELPAVSL
jgi:site-specific recombinase XerD